MDANISGFDESQTHNPSGFPSPNPSPIRNRGGRPRLSDDQRKTVRIRVGFTLAEAEQLDEIAAEAGVDAFQLIRAAALQLKISALPSVNREVLIELNRVGNNLNQATKRLNSGEDADLIQEILDIQVAINSLKSSLLSTSE